MSATKPAAEHAGALLTIDLAALKENYRRLCQQAKGVPLAAVVKADAYGLGAAACVPALAEAGAETFFVVQLAEGIAVRAALAACGREARIFVLLGPLPGSEPVFLEHKLTPVLNTLGDIERWRTFAARQDKSLPAVLHVDTGMNRLGLEPAEVARLANEPELLNCIDVVLVMSHLACAEEAEHPLNARQLARFQAARARLPRAPASFANSSGLFRGPDYLFDLGRPGAALYGINPTPAAANPMCQVAQLQARIVQVRTIDPPETVGYGAAHSARRRSQIATVALGYADGYLRSLSNRGCGWIAGQRVPLVGRVSMDLTTFDVTDLPAGVALPGAMIELLGPALDCDGVGAAAGTIGYEILTSLGSRYHRSYHS